MTQLKQLLAATDLSAPARHAVERAAWVARAAGAQLDLVHVADDTRLDELRRLVANLPPEIALRIREQSEMLVGALAAMVRARHGMDVTTHVVSGPLLRAIDEVAAQVDADILVFGARGSSMLRHLVLGSTAERLVSRSKRPLLVVKHAAAAAYRCVLVPVDFSEASLPALQLARAVAPQARLVLMHAYEAPFEGKLRLAGIEQHYLDDYRQSARVEAQNRMGMLSERAGLLTTVMDFVLAHGPAVQRILEQEEDEDCDLIVVGREGRSRVGNMLLGSVTRRLLAESVADVLVVP